MLIEQLDIAFKTLEGGQIKFTCKVHFKCIMKFHPKATFCE